MFNTSLFYKRQPSSMFKYNWYNYVYNRHSTRSAHLKRQNEWAEKDILV